MRDYLLKKVGTLVCPCLGGVPVTFDADGVKEIAQHAAKSAKSTKYALMIDEIIEKARFEKMTLPKDNKTQKQLRLLFMYVLKYKISEKESVKITIGVRENPIKFLQYCITVPK